MHLTYKLLPHLAETQTFCTVTCERSRGLTWICCWSRLILCCCWISCCCCLAIWDTQDTFNLTRICMWPTNCKSQQNIWILNIHLNKYDGSTVGPKICYVKSLGFMSQVLRRCFKRKLNNFTHQSVLTDLIDFHCIRLKSSIESVMSKWCHLPPGYF